MLTFFVFLGCLYVALSFFKIAFTFLEIKRQQCYFSSLVPANEEDITVLQPILGGDPALSYCLAENLKNAPRAIFIWIIDDNDLKGIEAAKKAINSCGSKNVKISINEPPPKNMNPKIWKIKQEISNVKTKFLALLDDDTILPPKSLSRAASIANLGNLVTGLPTYSSRENILSRMVTGFVNANSILTYLPTSYFKISNTINGMFSLMRSQDINEEDLNSIITKITDDYNLAKIFKNKGIKIAQTIIFHPIITTISSPYHYNSLMKRWFIFIKIYLRENLSLPLILMITAPSILPSCLIALAIYEKSVSLIFISLFLILIKTLILRIIRKKIGFTTPRSDIIFELQAELMVPLYLALTLISSNKIVWRNQEFQLNKSGVIKNDNI